VHVVLAHDAPRVALLHWREALLKTTDSPVSTPKAGYQTDYVPILAGLAWPPQSLQAGGKQRVRHWG